jgi:hypothetical protein
MPLYQPNTAIPGMASQTQIIASRTTQAVLQNGLGTRRRPQPPRSLIAQAGSLVSLITWNAPQVTKGIVGWRFYKDNETNLVDDIRDPTRRQYKMALPANKTTMAYVSSITQQNVESIKVGILVHSNTDQLVVAGTGGGTNGSQPSNPPGWGNEFSGGQCVAEGTEIVPLGEAEYKTVEHSEWVEIHLADGRSLCAVPDHPVYREDAGRTKMSMVEPGYELLTDKGVVRVESVDYFIKHGRKVVVTMKKGHLYWANGILSHNTKRN